MAIGDFELNRKIWVLNKRKGVPFSEIGRMFGISRMAATGRSHRHKLALVDDDRDLDICASLDRGETTARLASRYDLPRQHVKNLLSELEALGGL